MVLRLGKAFAVQQVAAAQQALHEVHFEVWN